MARFGFVGPSYQSQSVNADAQRCMNWYPEMIESGQGASAAALYPTPGQVSFAAMPAAPVRGLYYCETAYGGHLFAVAGNSFCEVYANGSIQVYGTLSNSGPRPVQMVCNNTGQILICDGKNLYIFLLADTSLPIKYVRSGPGDPPYVMLQYTAPIPWGNGTRISTTGLTLNPPLSGWPMHQAYLDTSGSYPNAAWYVLDDVADGTYPPIAAGTETGSAFIWNLTPGEAFRQVATGMGPFSQICYLDGYFIALQELSQNFYISNLEDGSQWDPTMYQQVELFTDNVLGMVQDHEMVTLFGTKRSVSYYSTGDPKTPFAPVQSSVVDVGAAISPTHDNFSMAILNNSAVLLSGNELGQMIAMQLQGYTPQRISTHAVENIWRTYPNGGADGIGFAYQENGHAFWSLYFPGANATWVYDGTTNMWHERGCWSTSAAKYVAWEAYCHAFAFGQHLVGGITSSAVLTQGVDLQTDAFGNNIRRFRRAPHITQEMEWQFHHKLRVHLESGLGPTPPLVGTAPVLPPTVLLDPSGRQWQVTVSDAGAISTALTSGLTPRTYIFVDIALISLPEQIPTICYQLNVSNTGVLSLTRVQAQLGGWIAQLPMNSQPSLLQTRLTVQHGVLTADTPQAYTREPAAMLRWSDDGGHTWSNEYTCGAGMAGNFTRRVEWRRLGRTRDRVYELSVSDPIPWRVIDAYLTATPGYQPIERYATQMQKMA